MKQRWRMGIAAALVATLAACAEQAGTPLEPRGISGASATTQTTSWTTGDTLFSQFDVAPAGGTFNIVGRKFRIDFPQNAICDLQTSSYGPREWDEPCAPETEAVRVSTKIWLDGDGHPHIDFQPAMRFSPALAKGVVLYLKDRNAQYRHDMSILYCATEAACYDESASDPSLLTFVDPVNGLVFRRIKHFSGYNVTAGRATQAVDAVVDATLTESMF